MRISPGSGSNGHRNVKRPCRHWSSVTPLRDWLFLDRPVVDPASPRVCLSLASHRDDSRLTFSLNMSQPDGMPPTTPGPRNRIHRPRDSVRYHPYEPSLFVSPGPRHGAHDENTPTPATPRSPFDTSLELRGEQYTSEYPSTSLRRVSSASALLGSQGSNIATSAASSGFISPAHVKLDMEILNRDLWGFKKEINDFVQVCMPT